MTKLNEYVVKLKRFGFKSHDAVRIYQMFKAYIDLKYLNDLIEEMESDNYVAKV